MTFKEYVWHAMFINSMHYFQTFFCRLIGTLSIWFLGRSGSDDVSSLLDSCSIIDGDKIECNSFGFLIIGFGLSWARNRWSLSRLSISCNWVSVNEIV
jgi:hypothetical protein